MISFSIRGISKHKNAGSCHNLTPTYALNRSKNHKATILEECNSLDRFVRLALRPMAAVWHLLLPLPLPKSRGKKKEEENTACRGVLSGSMVRRREHPPVGAPPWAVVTSGTWSAPDSAGTSHPSCWRLRGKTGARETCLCLPGTATSQEFVRDLLSL